MSTHQKRATVRDVADLAGVSKSLVSLAFSEPERVSEARRSRILQAAKELSYAPNFLAKSLASNNAPFIGILVVNLYNPIFTHIAEAVRETLYEDGYYGLVISSTKPGTSTPSDRYGTIDPKTSQMLNDLKPQGLIIVGTAEHIQTLPQDIPIVYASVSAPPTLKASSVKTDDFKGISLLVDYYIQKGHRTISFIGGTDTAVSRVRRNSYLELTKEKGIPALTIDSGFSIEEGFSAGQQLLTGSIQPPHAIICVNDLCAIGVIDALEAAGHSVPNDFSVAGFDNTYLSSLTRISLTSIEPGNDAIGHEAAKLMIKSISDKPEYPQEVLITPTLVARSSTRTPAANRKH